MKASTPSGPSPDSKRSAQCAATGSCQACQDNYHELICFGDGTDLITGPYAVFGDSQAETLKFTHFFDAGVSFLPAFKLGADVNLTGPVPSKTRTYIESIQAQFSVEHLLARVLTQLGWSDYLSEGKPNWSKIVISGHSQGASHAGYIAYRREVQGALLLSGPQDVCGEDGATWAREASLLNRDRIFGCFALDEPGRPAILQNLGFISDVIQISMRERIMNHGAGEWCAPPAHCATGVDDQLASAAVEQCFTKLRVFRPTVPLWPPSAQGDPEQMGGFDGSWRILGNAFAAHATAGGRTVAKRGDGRVLHVSLPGTFTVPQQFSALLKFSAAAGLDTIGLDYGWGPSPDSKRNAQCASLGKSCQKCQDNYHELIVFGRGSDLISGKLPVFGDSQTETLKFTHFFNSGVSFLPAFQLGADVNIESPLPAGAREYLGSIKESFSVEVLLVKVLQELGWTDYLSSGEPDWTKIVISGHSQGASHAGYIAFRRNIMGALLLSGPQDACDDEGAKWAEEAAFRMDDRNIFGCYAMDEPGKAAIERNLEFMTQVTQVDITGRSTSYGTGAWCAPSTHCATGVDDQLADVAVEQCFSKLLMFSNALALQTPIAAVAALFFLFLVSII